MYRDLSDDTEARARLDEVTPLTPVLEALGFRRLGLVGVGREGAVEQVWVAREGDAYAEPAWMPGKTPHLSFRSIFEDGSIVETTLPRSGAVRFIPFWSRQHHPAAGYFLEERQGRPHEVWSRHRERLAQHAASRGTRPANHAELKNFLALAERNVRIARRRTVVAQLGGLALFLVVAIPVTLRKDVFPGWALPVTMGWWGLATWATFRLMLKAGIPRVRPLADLVAKVQR